MAWLGQGNVQNGYFYTMIVMGCLSIILFFICFGLTKERYTTDIAVNNQSSILDDLKTLLANKDWRILFALNVVNLIAVLFKGGTHALLRQQHYGTGGSGQSAADHHPGFRRAGGRCSPRLSLKILIK
ncbi:Xyloside transporter XynT [Klebsiella michiganensis]|uniref:Xyloside transporter XynT n=1 Tax=Klebsiella michiganensis TaxID=1134687 RepID=A0A7H4PHH1_9ENTR|nr:Xyloside transporter XynT [Klebsiella michiganensis]